MPELCLANARIVSDGRIFAGFVRLADGVIAEIGEGTAVSAQAIDCGGDHLCPGLIELHTDNLERHMQPRPGVHAPDKSAVIDHDSELAGTGITTVFDALRIGSITSDPQSGYNIYARRVADAINDLQGSGCLKISHYVHLRAELCSETLAEELDGFSEDDHIGIVSLMDHTPGQRQYRDLSKLEEYLRGKHGMSDEHLKEHFALLRELQEKNAENHRRMSIGLGRKVGALIASHDDTTEEDVEEAVDAGVRLAEFPTTRTAAASCARNGIAVMMGAPNLMRGRSHAGNVATAELAEAGVMDILSSDYVPSSLLRGGLMLGEMLGDLPKGLAAVTEKPAEAAGLGDRGRIGDGLRADIVRFRLVDCQPIIRGVWCAGSQVA